MDTKVLRNVFSKILVGSLVLRWPLDQLPSYAKVVGEDKRPAVVILAITSALMIAAVIERSVHKKSPHKAISCARWSLLSLSALSVSIDIPMSDSLMSTIRCYALIALLCLQARSIRAEGDGSDCILDCISVHLAASMQLPLLLGPWARLSELVDSGGELTLVLLTFSSLLWISWLSVHLALVFEQKKRFNPAGKQPNAGVHIPKDFNRSSEFGKRKDAFHDCSSAEDLRGWAANRIVYSCSINFFLLSVLQFY
ncbi:hypothetical protein FA10DRAFT_270224 [Acaromyces ingoldii]|uniref:Uncharacterized protein n=1 Tax=Acaromyces ingoldii TaxID=215250 RepID=A0A316YC19_9BASI|nr:hypothetical protein FA10DRAFT_270224 [Acaromyces ingoldii]PWN86454.1 hypothetical protein FA10DRAFT_270224 [Acaromyces ingoldii]